MLQNEATTFAGVGSALPRKALELASHEQQAHPCTPGAVPLTMHGHPARRAVRRVCVAAAKRAIQATYEGPDLGSFSAASKTRKVLLCDNMKDKQVVAVFT